MKIQCLGNLCSKFGADTRYSCWDMTAFVTGPPGNIFGKTAIFVHMVRDNRRAWRPTSKPPHSQSGRFRELVRGLAGSLGMAKCNLKLIKRLLRSRSEKGACIRHSVNIAIDRSGWLPSAPTPRPIVFRGCKLASWTLGSLLNILSTKTLPWQNFPVSAVEAYTPKFNFATYGPFPCGRSHISWRSPYCLSNPMHSGQLERVANVLARMRNCIAQTAPTVPTPMVVVHFMVLSGSVVVYFIFWLELYIMHSHVYMTYSDYAIRVMVLQVGLYALV